MTGSCSGCVRDPLQKYTPTGSGVVIRMMTTTMMMIIMLAIPLFCDAFSSPQQHLMVHHGDSVLPRNKYRIKSSDRCGFRNVIAATAASPSPPPMTELSLSAEDDDNDVPTTNDTNDSENNNNDTTAPDPIEEEKEAADTETEAYDFTAGFKARVQQEGGKQTLQRKVVTTKAQKVASSTTQDFVQSIAQNPVVYGLVAFIVLVAVASLFTSPAPFEQSTNGEQLNFGVR